MAEIIELDRHSVTTVEETIALASRADLSHVVVFGLERDKKCIHIYEAGEDRIKNAWLAQKAAQILLDTS